MTNSPSHSDSHVADGALLALLDGEAGSELAVARTHVEHCAACRARRDAVESHSNEVSDLLSSIAVSSVSAEEFRRRVVARRRRASPLWRRPAWRATAAVVVLAAAAAASPIRHWIRGRAEQPRVEGAPSPTGVVSPSVQPTAPMGSAVSFAPTGAVFTVRFDSVPTAGVLNAERTTEQGITARVAGAGSGTDGLVVLPGELRVRNSGSSRADYRLSLPPVVTRLRVLVAGQASFDGPPPASVRLRSVPH